MKKVVCFLLALCLMLCMAACGRPISTSSGTGKDETQQSGQTEQPEEPEGSLKLSADMFDGAHVVLDGADSIGLITEEDPEGKVKERPFIAAFKDDGTFEKLAFLFPSAAGGEYEVSQQQIDAYPLNLIVTDTFIFLAYTKINWRVEEYINDAGKEYRFNELTENFVIDRATGKLYSLHFQESFSIYSDSVIQYYANNSLTYGYLRVEDGELTLTDLMPNKRIEVEAVCEDGFGNVYIQNDTVSEKQGNFIYVKDFVCIGDNGYAYKFPFNLDSGFLIDTCVLLRYDRNGELEDNWVYEDTIIEMTQEIGENDGCVSLCEDEMFVLFPKSTLSDSWYGFAYGKAGTYLGRAYLNVTDPFLLSPRLMVAANEQTGEVYYYDLISDKVSVNDYSVEYFENQGVVVKANSLYSDGRNVYARAESVQGAEVYKLEQIKGSNGLPAVRAVPYQSAYEANVVTIQYLK